MTLTFRALTDDDLAAHSAESADAFGTPVGAAAGTTTPLTTEHRWGLVEGGVLAAQAIDFEYHSYFGGASLPTAGIGNVTVALEYRGRGAARRLMTETLVQARERGAVLSTLFGGAPDLYRRLGYGSIALSQLWRIPLSRFTGIRHSNELRLVRATAEHRVDIARIYRQAAVRGSAMIDRTALALNDRDNSENTTLVVDALGSVHGYLTWSRQQEVVRVRELHADSADSLRTLLSSLATWASVVTDIEVQCTAGEPWWHLLPGSAAPVSVVPYMLRVLDVARAIEGRAWSSDARAQFTLVDDTIPENSGSWDLTVADGQARVVPPTSPTAQPASLTLSAQGFALWYAGTLRADELRGLDLLTGDDPESEHSLDALFAAPAPRVTEHF